VGPLEITTTSLNNGRLRVAYKASLAVNEGSPATWTVTTGAAK
jgi:hypothetical protein